MIRFTLFILLTVAMSSTAFTQNIDYNIQSGYVASGYDVTEYFNHQAVKGNKKFSYTYEGASYLFSNESNLNQFKESPSKYIPQYGGWCAYAMGKNNDKVNINPKTFEIRNGKLYLFYNAYFTNTLKGWKKENPEALRTKADANWKDLKYKG